jgi:hypothetical protein
MPTSASYFYNFLVHELKVEASLTLFALYADLRRYLVLCSDGAPENDRRELARNIYQDFILERKDSCFELPRNAIVKDLERGITPRGEICFELNEALFHDLYQFAIGGLEVFYDLFK